MGSNRLAWNCGRCWWLLKKFKISRGLPISVLPYRHQLMSLIVEEMPLEHGSTDILGDAWLKFRRVASQIKKAHPELRNRDIFQAILIIHAEVE